MWRGKHNCSRLDMAASEKGIVVDFPELDPTQIRMPFGNHVGEKLCDLPSAYLRWWLKNENSSKLKDALLLKGIQMEVEKREKKNE